MCVCVFSFFFFFFIFLGGGGFLRFSSSHFALNPDAPNGARWPAAAGEPCRAAEPLGGGRGRGWSALRPPGARRGAAAVPSGCCLQP